MALTYSTSNRLIIPAKGDLRGTYATAFWQPTAELIDQALDGILEVTVSGSVTLTSANGTVTGDQARNRLLILSGTGGTVTVPAVEKVYHIVNNCTGSVVFTQGSGTTCTIPPGHASLVYAYNSGGAICAYKPMATAEGTVIQSGAIASAATISCTIPTGIKRVRAYLNQFRQTTGGAVNVNFRITQGGVPVTLQSISLPNGIPSYAVFDATWDGTTLKYEYDLANGSSDTTSAWMGDGSTVTAMSFEMVSGVFDANGTATFRGFV